ncbi:uncharacterized protein LOC128266062 [Drosophila gunungcola]|uniref:uncharacterized protein LOC128266062 n=1 Tax=Drosophila gunungcola TaxID=103775 RepID=UPI0022DFF04D|nr:uncharacterized protein LOC128266062 [Drosophila gunungcola]
MEPFAFAYLDDIVVIGRTKREHLEKLQEEELKYLGHVISARGIHTDPEKIAAILNMPSPQTTKQVHSFLGVASWYRRFIPNFTYNLVKKGTKFKWTEETEEATKI